MNQNFEMIRARLKAAQDQKKSYADKHRQPIEFHEGDMVMLKVSSWKGMIRFRKWVKHAPRLIRPFKVLAHVGEIANRLEFLEELVGIHNTFHFSYLRKCLADDSMWVPLDEITLNNKQEYVEEPVVILDEKVKEIQNKRIQTYKVQWHHRKGFKCTRELEDGAFTLVICCVDRGDAI
ncbi:uncharacterized protein [Rutidosis leptorrhynchoides]|uniref:uncharacterized protein n=1 Tax=Rutidosis leptorrhynchoides TaxID=125765 RepID=UPI003A9A4A03